MSKSEEKISQQKEVNGADQRLGEILSFLSRAKRVCVSTCMHTHVCLCVVGVGALWGDTNNKIFTPRSDAYVDPGDQVA